MSASRHPPPHPTPVTQFHSSEEYVIILFLFLVLIIISFISLNKIPHSIHLLMRKKFSLPFLVLLADLRLRLTQDRLTGENKTILITHIHGKGASLVAQLVKNLPAMQQTLVPFLVGKFPWRRDSPPATVFLGFPGGSDSKRIHLQCRKPGFDTWVEKIPWRRAWQSLQYSCLENFIDGGAWWPTFHGVTKSQTQLND